MDEHTSKSFYTSVRVLKQNHPEYRNLKVHNLFGRKRIKGKLNRDGTITLQMKVYRIEKS